MTGHSAAVFFSKAAQDDWDDILFFCEARWGDDKARIYEEVLTAAIVDIADFPEFGWRIEYIHPAAHCTGVGAHMLYFSCEPGLITIQRVLNYDLHVSHDLFDFE